MGWVVENQILRHTARGVPSGEDIYSAVFEDAGPLVKCLDTDSRDELGLTFSQYPAALVAILSNPESDGFPVVKLEARSQDGITFPVPTAVLSAGHLVSEGVWYPVDPEDVARIGELLPDADYGAENRVREFRRLLDLKQTAARADSPIRDDLDHDSVSALRFVPPSDDLPVGISANLYPYQREGWNWLRFLMGNQVGGLLADEMGLGKTLQVISAIKDSGGNRSLFPALVVAPGSLLENWRREFGKFAPTVKTRKHQGAMRTGRPDDLKQFDVVITSYDTVVRDLSLMKMIDWNVVVADEAQNIKNPEALRTRSIKQLPRRVSLAMTGTPVENGLTDLWSVIDFAVPGYLGELDDFRATFDDSVSDAARVEPLVSPLMLRRIVENVAKDLPERIDVPQVLELSEGEAEEYERIRASIADEYGTAATLVSLTSLRQFCAHPGLLDPRAPSGQAEFTKLQRLREILEEIFFRQEKVIVFTSYTEMSDMIRGIVRDNFGVFAECLDGRVAIDERQPLIDRFSAIEGSAALVLNPKAGGAGLNITAANHVVHYNLEWNPALEDQASARAHRRGQTRPVTVHRLYFADTVEETVNDRIERKRALSEAAVVGVEGKDGDLADIVSALSRSPVRKANS